MTLVQNSKKYNEFLTFVTKENIFLQRCSHLELSHFKQFLLNRRMGAFFWVNFSTGKLWDGGLTFRARIFMCSFKIDSKASLQHFSRKYRIKRPEFQKLPKTFRHFKIDYLYEWFLDQTKKWLNVGSKVIEKLFDTFSKMFISIIVKLTFLLKETFCPFGELTSHPQKYVRPMCVTYWVSAV